jgi:hypothetical protein
MNVEHRTSNAHVKLPAYQAGLQNNIIIHNYSICVPLFGKEGLGEIF